MTQRSYDERLAELKKKQEQLIEQQKQLKRRQSEEERKRRTRRLIELGGIVESVLGRPTVDEDKERFLLFLNRQEANGKFFTRAMNRPGGNEMRGEKKFEAQDEKSVEEKVKELLGEDSYENDSDWRTEDSEDGGDEDERYDI